MTGRRDLMEEADESTRPALSPRRSATPLGADGFRDDAHAVIIGINRYQDPKIPDLRYARADAEAVYQVLTDPVVGRFRPTNVTLLLDADATERRIRSVVGTELPRRAAPDDTVFVYYAGHGAPVIDPRSRSSDGMEKYLIPYDAAADDLRASAISMDAIQQFFSWIESRQVVFFIDSCYSGSAGGRSFQREGVQTRAVLSDEFLDGLAAEGRLVVTACSAGELSLETPEKGHGLFTHYLVDGLRGAADTGKDGLVTLDELYDYVYRNVDRDARSLGGSMKPLRKGSVSGTVYLTQYETEAQRRARELDTLASAARARGDRDEAERLWRDVLAAQPSHPAAQAGLAAIAAEREAEREALEAEARRRAAELERQHMILLGHWRAKTLPTARYEQALALLDRDAESLTGVEQEIRRLLDDLLEGTIGAPTYARSVNLLLGVSEPSIPAMPAAARPQPAPQPAPQSASPPAPTPPPAQPVSPAPPVAQPVARAAEPPVAAVAAPEPPTIAVGAAPPLTAAASETRPAPASATATPVAKRGLELLKEVVRLAAIVGGALLLFIQHGTLAVDEGYIVPEETWFLTILAAISALLVLWGVGDPRQRPRALIGPRPGGWILVASAGVLVRLLWMHAQAMHAQAVEPRVPFVLGTVILGALLAFFGVRLLRRPRAENA